MNPREVFESEFNEVTEFFDCDCCGRNTLYWKNSNLAIMIGAGSLYALVEGYSTVKQVKHVLNKKTPT